MAPFGVPFPQCQWIMDNDMSTMAVPSDLRRVIALSEEVKAVADVSRGLCLEAINAMLVSRRAGDGVKGFGVVSTELRRYSADLETLMRGLVADIATLVHSVANLSREDNLHRQLARAHAACGDCAGMARAMARVELAARRAAEANARDWRKVLAGIERSVRLCDTGRALARGAKIEAVYGGGMSGDLTQAGLAIERTIDKIRDRLLVGAAIAGAM